VAIIGFVGLGVMGGNIATRLLDAGHAVQGYNRTIAKAESLVALGMTLAATPRGRNDNGKDVMGDG
jgi:2-hydroxy-3-oxopropionate reductase